ncbi:hypothetical protein Fmac_025471 [Flemingia macrophylla]|uniref:Uncharacterized protein n=1 Tax=Flemingia macrophylla TaxID=520843 RepID=A0ABD1LSB0_9FABA
MLGYYPFRNLRAAADLLFLHGGSDMVIAKQAIEACRLLPEITGPTSHPKIVEVLLERGSPDTTLMVLRWAGHDGGPHMTSLERCCHYKTEVKTLIKDKNSKFIFLCNGLCLEFTMTHISARYFNKAQNSLKSRMKINPKASK